MGGEMQVEDVLYSLLSQLVVLLRHCSEAGVLEKLISVCPVILRASRSLG